jgi:acetyl-CoA synthetase (ADP-forming)
LSAYQIPVTRELLVKDEKYFTDACKEIGFPVVLKGCGEDIAHKTERGLIHVDVRNEQEARVLFEDIMSKLSGNDPAVLVQEMVKGQRELVAGLTRDPQFGPCVMFGLGGIFTEVLKDISFRVAPLEKYDAMEMMQEIKANKILTAIRGMEAADQDALAEILITLGNIGLEHDSVKEIDINPLVLSGSKPVAVDALVVLSA